LDWGDASGDLWFLAGSSRITIRAEGVLGLSCTREAPWGPSVSVNSAAIGSALDGKERELRIEMQSGGILIVRGGKFVRTDHAQDFEGGQGNRTRMHREDKDD